MYKRDRKTKRSSLLRKKRSYGGDNVHDTQEERISYAVRGNYTPLINAILEINTGEVRRILDRGGNASQPDDTYRWCPFKWLEFVRMYGGRNGDTISNTDYATLVEVIHRAGGQECYDDYHVRENSYNFSPVVTDIDEQLEQIRREAEEDPSYDDDDYHANTKNTSGGRRRRRRKTHKRSKSQKRNNKKRRTRKRKHSKK
jgi:hypothetical protein